MLLIETPPTTAAFDDKTYRPATLKDRRCFRLAGANHRLMGANHRLARANHRLVGANRGQSHQTWSDEVL
ncbi:hypothetical protein [Alloprevotella tannerae]|uniref:hypothetical protein n=1 Tax=Alloprevotella tannerae TaxID=76122 RepID=UPI0028E4A1DC|nr:hypothetical protein [Alloprevotella tannerae]